MDGRGGGLSLRGGSGQTLEGAASNGEEQHGADSGYGQADSEADPQSLHLLRCHGASLQWRQVGVRFNSYYRLKATISDGTGNGFRR